MKKYKVVVFGDLPIATKVVIELKKIKNIELIGVVIGNDNPNNNDPWTDIPCLAKYIEGTDIGRLTFTDLKSMYLKQELDLGLSCRFSKIIKKEIIDLFKIGIINMHGGLLPEFAGLYSANFSVLYDAKLGGGTLHYIDEGIDTGEVIRRCEFNILENDTGFNVFQKTQKALYKNLIDIIPLVLEGKIESTPLDEFIKKGYPSRYFKRNSINQYKEISHNELLRGDILKKVRAFDFPGYEPAYILVDGKKVYLRMK